MKCAGGKQGRHNRAIRAFVICGSLSDLSSPCVPPLRHPRGFSLIVIPDCFYRESSVFTGPWPIKAPSRYGNPSNNRPVLPPLPFGVLFVCRGIPLPLPSFHSRKGSRITGRGKGKWRGDRMGRREEICGCQSCIRTIYMDITMSLTYINNAVQTFFSTGNFSVNRAPPSGRFSAVSEPPCASANLRAIANPNPDPPSKRERPESSR